MSVNIWFSIFDSQPKTKCNKKQSIFSTLNENKKKIYSNNNSNEEEEAAAEMIPTQTLNSLCPEIDYIWSTSMGTRL